MKIYLAIAYSGMEQLSFQTANRVAGRLMNDGHIVFSPISHTHPIAVECKLPGGWDYWRKFDEAFLSWCDCVYVVRLDGWERSKGVAAECAIARDMSKPVVYVDP